MGESQNKRRHDWLWTLLVVENSVILLVLIIFGLRACLFSIPSQPLRDFGSRYLQNEPDYSYMYVHTPPEKLIYIAGKDTSLDLAGGKVCYSVYPEYANGLPCAQNDDADCENIRDMEELKVKAEIDFSKPGVYLVTLEDDSRTFSTWCHFYIQVISPDYVE